MVSSTLRMFMWGTSEAGSRIDCYSACLRVGSYTNWCSGLTLPKHLARNPAHSRRGVAGSQVNGWSVEVSQYQGVAIEP